MKHPHIAGRPATSAILLIACAVALLLLPGCGTAPPASQLVNVPVFTSCMKAVPVRPAFAAPSLPATVSDGEKVLALARDTLLHFKYESQLEALVVGCL